MAEYPVHPAALIFPEMDGQTFADLKADIAKHGQQEDAVVHQGQLLDGRHRQRACRELGIALKVGEWKGGDPIAYVVSRNLKRRHLTTSQLAMCAARAKGAYAEQAKERQRQAGGDRKSAKAKSVGPNLGQPIPDAGRSADHVAEQFGVGGTLDMMEVVYNKGRQQLVGLKTLAQMAMRERNPIATKAS